MPSADVQRARVLVVDDEPGLLRAAERVLSPHHQVACAGLPSEALALIAGFAPDLVVCDIRMPQMDGFALVDALRATCPDLDAIFMTGSHSDPDAQLVRSIRERAFYFIQKPFDRQVLETLVDRCLELRRLRHAERAHMARLQDELGAARAFQGTMLAPDRAAIGRLRVQARCEPSGELAGDIYDFVQTGPDALAFIVADVRGHGVAAALLTALVKAAFRSEAASGYDPARVVGGLARSMRAFPSDRFITAYCGRLDAGTGVMEGIGAGHPPPIIRGEGHPAAQLPIHAPLLSAQFAAGPWNLVSIRLPPRAEVLVYSDGLTESAGSRDRFGIGRVLEAVAGAPPGHSIAAVFAARDAFADGRPAADDITAMSIAVD